MSQNDPKNSPNGPKCGPEKANIFGWQLFSKIFPFYGFVHILAPYSHMAIGRFFRGLVQNGGEPPPLPMLAFLFYIF